MTISSQSERSSVDEAEPALTNFLGAGFGTEPNQKIKTKIKNENKNKNLGQNKSNVKQQIIVEIKCQQFEKC